METVIQKAKQNKIISTLLSVVNDELYPFINAFVFSLLYFLALDIVALYYLAFSIIFTLLFTDDITPFFSQIIYVNFVVSYQNSPSAVAGSSSYYLNPVIYVQIIILVFLCALTVIYRLVKAIREGKFRFNGVALSLVIFAGSLLLGGLFSKNYSWIDVFYGFALAFFFCIINFVFNGNAKVNKENLRKICLSFVALTVLLVVELVVKYVTNFENIIVNSSIDKSGLTFGWGVWNTMSMYLTISIPAIFYLACTEDKGYLYFVYAIFIAICIFLVSSRQGMLAVIILFPICLFLLLKYGKHFKINLIITCVCAAVGLIFIGVFFDKFCKLFSGIFTALFNEEGGLSGSNRVELFLSGMKKFVQFPIFGAGFDEKITYAIEFVGLNGLIPLMYHNTIAQIMASCGAIGIIAYGFHRFQTIKNFLKKPTLARGFIGLSVLALLFINMFDNHLFYFFATMIYASLIHYVTNQEEQN